MNQKPVHVLCRDADSERQANQLPTRAVEQTNCFEIDFFNPANAIERDVTDRSKIEKIDIPLVCLFQCDAGLLKRQRRY